MRLRINVGKAVTLFAVILILGFALFITMPARSERLRELEAQTNVEMSEDNLQAMIVLQEE